MTPRQVGGVLATVLVAALAAGLPAAFLTTIDVDSNLRLALFADMLAMSVALVTVIGLPTSLVAYLLLKDRTDIGLGGLLFLANTIAVTLILMYGSASGAFGAVFVGIPILLAANSFALTGWAWVLKPYRQRHA